MVGGGTRPASSCRSAERRTLALGGMDYRIDWRPGTRRAARAAIDLAVDGGADRGDRAARPDHRVPDDGLGYIHAEWNHGAWKGDLALGGTRWALPVDDPLSFHHLHIQALCRATMGGDGLGPRRAGAARSSTPCPEPLYRAERRSPESGGVAAPSGRRSDRHGRRAPRGPPGRRLPGFCDVDALDGDASPRNSSTAIPSMRRTRRRATVSSRTDTSPTRRCGEVEPNVGGYRSRHALKLARPSTSSPDCGSARHRRGRWRRRRCCRRRRTAKACPWRPAGRRVRHGPRDGSRDRQRLEHRIAWGRPPPALFLSTQAALLPRQSRVADAHAAVDHQHGAVDEGRCGSTSDRVPWATSSGSP